MFRLDRMVAHFSIQQEEVQARIQVSELDQAVGRLAGFSLMDVFDNTTNRNATSNPAVAGTTSALHRSPVVEKASRIRGESLCTNLCLGLLQQVLETTESNLCSDRLRTFVTVIGAENETASVKHFSQLRNETGGLLSSIVPHLVKPMLDFLEEHKGQNDILSTRIIQFPLKFVMEHLSNL